VTNCPDIMKNILALKTVKINTSYLYPLLVWFYCGHITKK